MLDSKITARRREIEELCDRTKNILFGNEFPLSRVILQSGKFSKAAVVSFVDAVISGVDAASNDEIPLVRAFLETTVCFLFSECNDEDCVFGSLYKIAQLFSQDLSRPFETTTFGHMIAAAYESSHLTPIDQKAFVCLKQKVKILTKLLLNTPTDRITPLDIDKYLDAYIRNNSLSCLHNDQKYEQALQEIARLHFRINLLLRSSD